VEINNWNGFSCSNAQVTWGYASSSFARIAATRFGSVFGFPPGLPADFGLACRDFALLVVDEERLALLPLAAFAFELVFAFLDVFAMFAWKIYHKLQLDVVANAASILRKAFPRWLKRFFSSRESSANVFPASFMKKIGS
jgi:hypothetical protein